MSETTMVREIITIRGKPGKRAWRGRPAIPSEPDRYAVYNVERQRRNDGIVIKTVEFIPGQRSYPSMEDAKAAFPDAIVA